MTIEVTREEIIQTFYHAGLDSLSMEDVQNVVDMLLEAFSPYEVLTWLAFYNQELDGMPVILLRQGKIDRVMALARQMILSESTMTEAMGS